MAIIKDYEEKKTPWWKKTLRWIGGILAVVILIGFLGFILEAGTPNVPPPEMKYQVIVSNSIGSDYFDCERYERVDNTYILYDTLGVKTNEITITDGYAIRVNLKRR